MAKAAFFGASANVINTAYQQSDDPCKSFNLKELVRSGLYGAGGGMVGYSGGAVGKKLFKSDNVIGSYIGKKASTSYETSGTAIGAAVGGFIGNQ